MTLQRFALALETSTRSASLALHVDGETHLCRLAADAAHASDLLPLYAQTLRRMGLDPAGLELVVVGTGPGSFTGLRVGISVALGLTRAGSAHTVAVPSVAAAAWRHLEPGEVGTVVLDARGGGAYVAAYRRGNQGQAEPIETLLEPVRIPLAQAPETTVPGGVYLGDERGPEWFADERVTIPWRAAPPDAEALMVLGQAQWERAGATPTRDVRPLYLAPFGA